MIEIPRLPLAAWIDNGLEVLTDHFATATKIVSDVMENGIDNAVDGLMWLPPGVTILLFALLAWRLAGVHTALLSLFGFALLWNLGLWEPTLQTLVLVLIATFVAVAIGTPLGVIAALSSTAYRVVFPVLDFMQTMPAFVYLIPAIPFFGLGPVAAVFSTVIFAMPPAIRLTTLGIRQVPADLVEAADAFGSTRWQKLTKVQLPLAVPTIMAGINQTIMLALSMVVIAAMIGAQGLGGEVWRAIQRNEAGMGFEAGIAVVVLAMVLDRITQGIARRKPGTAG
ncbi:ABC transporter permease [Thiocystis violacea]|uniref:ABC transporter permease n=1 Tax=Thiocystis violacea TaxID=13725 RepID=UPI001906CC04|nr:proline/glycine betaine ABC transporter permease [Thiocystis violacea]MBK1724247.1 ABC transporter permease [Thiocystis violacea]